MLFAALSNSVCLNNASSFSFVVVVVVVDNIVFFCQGYELSGEIALKNNHYYYPLLFKSRLKTYLFRSVYKD